MTASCQAWGGTAAGVFRWSTERPRRAVDPALRVLTDVILGPGDNASLPDGSRYVVTSRTTGVMTLRPGFGANFRFADFQVTSQGEPPPQYAGERGVQAVVDFGPIPTGTMY